MKKYKENNIVKLVYKTRFNIGGYWRLHKFTDTYSSLDSDFPIIYQLASCYDKFTLHYLNSRQDITSWVDKHGNVIIRIIDLNTKQTKLNF